MTGGPLHRTFQGPAFFIQSSQHNYFLPTSQVRKPRLTEALAKVARLLKSSKPHDLTLGCQAVGWDPSRLALRPGACGALCPPPGAKVAEDSAHLPPGTDLSGTPRNATAFLWWGRGCPQPCLPEALVAKLAKRCSRR